MNRDEAQRLLARTLAEYRGLPYAQLVAQIDTDKYLAVTGPSGTEYQVEIQFLWDDRQGGNVRVLGGIDDGSFGGAFRPVCDDFLVGPDDRLVGE